MHSQFHAVELRLTGVDEPNNGRMLHIAELYIEGKNETKTYFGDWPRLDFELNNYIMDSPDGKFIFIPAEGGGFLIETKSWKKISLPYKALSTMTFLGNEFLEKVIRLKHTDGIIEVDLITGLEHFHKTAEV